MGVHERILSILSLKYVDEVIIGAPLKVEDNLLKNFNVSVVVKGEDYFEPTENIGDPYTFPKKQGLFIDSKIENDFYIEVLIQRIIDNKMNFIKSNLRKKEKLKEYYENQKSDIKSEI